MSDVEDLIGRIEGGTLGPGEFHHRDHVMLAWAYLARYDFPTALARFISSLKSYATRMGRVERYHETITCAWVTLIHERARAPGGFESWTRFARANEDLFRGPVGILADYYREDTLASPFAREVFVLPDKGAARPRVPDHS
jgi:hypothetical protein